MVAGLITLLAGSGSAQIVEPAAAPAGDPVAPAGTVDAGELVSLDLLSATLWMQQAAERRALCRQTFALARLRLEQALADPGWSAAEEQDPGAEVLPPAVIVDVDETVLDNHWYQARLVRRGTTYDTSSWNAWCRELAATAVPGALDFCRFADSRGVAVFYVTNRREEVAAATRRNLELLGFPVADGRVLARTGSSDKTARRRAVAAGHRVLLLVGDNGGDFAAALDDDDAVARRAVVEASASRWGREWIVLPNPMYGRWERAVEAGIPDGLSVPDRVEARRRALFALPPASGPAAPSVPGPGAVPDDPGVAAAVGGDGRHPAIHAGPMAAWTEMTSCAVWLRTTRPARVQLRVWPAGAPSRARLTDVVDTTRAGDLLATFVLSGLAPGTDHAYEVYLDGERAAVPWPLVARTEPLWQWRGGDGSHAPPELTVLVGSCAYVNDPPFDRPGRPYGGDVRIFETMADERADLVLWLGDNVYYREPDWLDETAMRRRYAHTRALPAMQRLLAASHHYAIWDDHDYGPNDSDRGFRLRDTALEVFADYWPGVTFGRPEAPGCYRRFAHGDVEFFLLDDRSHRSPNDAPPGPDKTMLGEVQRRWLMDGLVSSRATFKVVANGGQLISPIARYEGWADFPHEQEAFLRFLAAERIDGVVFLSGDRHHTELLAVDGPDHPTWYEFTCSPLTAGPNDRDDEADNAARVPGTWVGQRNYGRLVVTGPSGARRLVLSAHDADGGTLWQHEITQDELAFDG